MAPPQPLTAGNPEAFDQRIDVRQHFGSPAATIRSSESRTCLVPQCIQFVVDSQRIERRLREA
jgi:hypothetical protein